MPKWVTKTMRVACGVELSLAEYIDASIVDLHIRVGNGMYTAGDSDTITAIVAGKEIPLSKIRLKIIDGSGEGVDRPDEDD